MSKVITIDGPAASGKTSVSRGLAQKLGWNWVSTGSFYRGLAFVAKEMSMNLEDESALADLVSSSKWRVEMAFDCTLVFFDDVDVTHEVHSENVGSYASKVSQYPLVRKALLQAQRDCAKLGNLVAEGRDCGSVVFPEAIIKVYLTASETNRARRRAEEQGLDAQKILQEQSERDARDSQRKVAPLQIPESAYVVDTSDMSLEAVIEKLYQHCGEHGVIG